MKRQLWRSLTRSRRSSPSLLTRHMHRSGRLGCTKSAGSPTARWGVGSEHEFVRVFAGRRMASRNRFVVCEPGRYVEFEIPSGWITGGASYLAEPGPAGGTVLTSRMQFHVRGPAALLEPVLARLLVRDSRRDGARLKSLLEHDGTSAAP